jgi:steroid 5-alpha reductase family enzyme
MAADPLVLVLQIYLAMTAVMVVLWMLDRHVRNASLADVGFCFGLIAAVLWYAGSAAGDGARKAVVVLLAAVYAGRLGIYILIDRILTKQEDARYQHLREIWGASATRKMFGYFHLQAVAVAVFTLPFVVVMQNPHPPFALNELIGLTVWIVAVVGEAVADRQLARFREKPWNRDRVYREGLWRYSRHPNYFFEWLHWWAYVVMAFEAPGWPLTLLGPVGMGWALVKVTGIPPAERQAVSHRSGEYRDYQETTSAFIPWFPRSRRPSRG